MMKLLFLSVLTPFVLLSSAPNEHPRKTRVFNLYPAVQHNTNGLSLSVWGEALRDYREIDLPTVNGVDINLNPWAPIAFLGGSMAISDLNVNGEWQDSSLVEAKFKKVNGLRIGLLQDDPTYVQGVQAHLVGNLWTVVKGVSLAGYCGRHYELHGVGISTLFNQDQITRGVQVALFYNQSEDLEGFQFGLWNKNQKRSLPFVNWSFSKDNK